MSTIVAPISLAKNRAEFAQAETKTRLCRRQIARTLQVV
jgi:hypothetical protein